MDTPLPHGAKEIDLLVQAEPGEWVWLADRWSDAAGTESAARSYLNAKEWEEYCTRASKRRSHWLMGRIAAKDAVRRWLYAQGADPLGATAIEIAPDQSGCPQVNMPGAIKARISIAHSGDFAVAMCNEEPTGIDIESVARYVPGLEGFALTAQEQVLLDQAVKNTDLSLSSSRARIFTRFWAAKEAVSKAEGTGLRGKPTAFAVNTFDEDRMHVTCKADKTGLVQEYVVQTSTLTGIPDADGICAEYIVAWTQTHSTLSCTQA